MNGIEVATVATSGDIYDNGGYPTHIGAGSSAPSFLEFVGRMDDLRVFAEALAPEELGDGVSLLLCGELTGDCAITGSDALAALRMAVSLEDPVPAADMNGSGSISATDALQLLRIGVGLQEHTGTCNA